MAAKELLTADEAASLLKIARRTLLKWARDRKIESVRVSTKIILFTAEAIERFLSDRTVGEKAATPIKARPEMSSPQRQVKQRGKTGSRTQTWAELRKEVLSWAKHDQE